MLRFIKIVFTSLSLDTIAHLIFFINFTTVRKEIIIVNKFFTPFGAIFTPFPSYTSNALVHAPELIGEGRKSFMTVSEFNSGHVAG